MRFTFPVVLAATLLLPAATLAQPRPVAPPPPRVEIPAGGTELLRAFLDSKGIKPVPRDELERGRLRNYEDVIVVMLGNQSTRWFGTDPFSLAHEVVDNGGAVLIASDAQTTYFSHWGQSQVQSSRVECTDQEACHRTFEDCPYVVALSDKSHRTGPESDTPPGQLFSGLTRVATNSPGYLRATNFRGEFRFALAKFPRGSVGITEDFRGNAQEHRLPDDALFAVGGHGPDPDNGNRSDYRFVMMADHSVFINQMLIEPGTENLELTYRTIDYLQGPNKRKRCLFIENGRVVEKFDGLRQAFAKPKPQLPMPNIAAMQDKLVDLGNAVVSDMQSRDVFNKVLVGAFGLPPIVRLLMLLAAIYGTWFLLRRMFGSRKPTDIPPPPAVAGVPAGPPGVFDRRQKELVRRNNVYEPVRDLVREFFLTLGVHGEPGPKPPRVAVSNAVRKPESLRQAVKDFWRLAYGAPQELSVSRWREMEPYFERLRQAHADGKWHFVLETAVAPA